MINRDEIIKLAREAGGVFDGGCWRLNAEFDEDDLSRFAALVAAAEREACAKVCTEIMDDFWMGDDRWEVGRHCAESIRARSNT